MSFQFTFKYQKRITLESRETPLIIFYFRLHNLRLWFEAWLTHKDLREHSEGHMGLENQ